MHKLTIVGSGPTAIYTIAALLDRKAPVDISVIEREALSGTGMPFRTGEADAIMLANIADIEIPPIRERFLEWVTALPPDVLAHFGLDRALLTERSFLPRVLLGAWLRHSLALLAAEARAAGHVLRIIKEADVVDVVATADGYRASFLQDGKLHATTSDSLVISTGHDWPLTDAPKEGYYASPWPSSKLQAVGPCEVGVIGTSLSGIDAALAIAAHHGTFTRAPDGSYSYATDARGLTITLMSRKGLLPEADFYCPLPYEPAVAATPERLAALEARGEALTAQDLFDLLRDEITAMDPQYAADMRLATIDLTEFPDRYFSPRIGRNQFTLAAANLAEVLANQRSRTTVNWRYAILRSHELIGPFVPRLSDAEKALFNSYLKPVFIDNYAAVPPQTIARLLALHRTDTLHVMALGAEAQPVRHPGRNGATVAVAGNERHFDVLIDARGQQAMMLEDLPFPTLRGQLAGQGGDPVALDDALRPYGANGAPMQGLHLAAISFLLTDRPFVQGITVSHEIGEAVAESLCARLTETQGAGFRSHTRRLAAAAATAP